MPPADPQGSLLALGGDELKVRGEALDGTPTAPIPPQGSGMVEVLIAPIPPQGSPPAALAPAHKHFNNTPSFSKAQPSPIGDQGSRLAAVL